MNDYHQLVLNIVEDNNYYFPLLWLLFLNYDDWFMRSAATAFSWGILTGNFQSHYKFHLCPVKIPLQYHLNLEFRQYKLCEKNRYH